MTKMDILLLTGHALANLRRVRTMTAKALEAKPPLHPTVISEMGVNTQATALYVKTLLDAQERGVLDWSFPLLRRDGAGANAILVLAFDGDELVVLGRDDDFRVEVMDEGDVVGAVHAWLESHRPDSSGLGVPRGGDTNSRVMHGLAEILDGYGDSR